MGISGAINHDAALCMVQDGEILFASHSERYSKRKNDPDLNFQLIQDAIHHAGKPDVIAWYERPSSFLIVKNYLVIICENMNL
jgi:carbamoyltransferase